MSRSRAMLVLLTACRSPSPSPPTTLPTECAPGFSVDLGACVPTPLPTPTCERGRARDLDDGRCLSRAETRTLALANGVEVAAEDDVVACEGGELVASRRRGKVGCLDVPAPPRRCRPGMVADGTACRPVVSKGVLDLASFCHAAAAAICESLARSSSSISAAPSATLAIELRAELPDNDLTLGFLTAKTHGTVSVPQADLERATAPVSDALRRLGQLAATSSASDVVAYASCAPGEASERRPRAFPTKLEE